MSITNIYKRKIEEEEQIISEANESIEILKKQMLEEMLKETTVKVGDKVEIEKNSEFKVNYEGVVASFELNDSFDICAKIFKLKKDKTPSKQIHPNGNVVLEEIKRVI